MAIDKVSNDILNRPVGNESVNKATSGKKETVKGSENELRKTGLEDKVVFSQDARKLQETEVILQSALQKLHEMDELIENDLSGIKNKIDDGFYSRNDVLGKVIDDVFPEQQLRNTVERRMKAETYLPELNRLDEMDTIDEKRLSEIAKRIDSGFYSSREVLGRVADELVNMSDV